MNSELKDKVVQPLKSLVDFRFIIPMLLLVLSLIGNGLQCGKDALLKHWLTRTKNALELAEAKNKNLEAKKAVYKYQATKKATNPIIDKNDKKLEALRKKAAKTEKALRKIRSKVGNLSVSGVVDEINKQLKSKKEELPLEPEEAARGRSND